MRDTKERFWKFNGEKIKRKETRGRNDIFNYLC